MKKEMKKKRGKMKILIERITKDIQKKLNENLVSLYLVGTAATAEEPEDIDFFALVKKANFDENELNEWLTKKYSFPIKLRAILYDELLGKVQKATNIMRFGIFPVSILTKILEAGRLVFGKKINFEKLPTKGITPEEYLEFEIRRLQLFLDFEKQGKELPFPREDFPKFVAYAVRAELLLDKGIFLLSYEEMSKQLKNEPNHIIHDCVVIKKRKKKLNKTFFKKVGIYIEILKKRS